MQCSRLMQMLEVRGEISIRNVTVFVGLMVSSAIVSYLTWRGDLTETIFGLWLSFIGSIYGVGKYRDSKENIAQINPIIEMPDVNSVDVKSDNVNIVHKKKGKNDAI